MPPQEEKFEEKFKLGPFYGSKKDIFEALGPERPRTIPGVKLSPTLSFKRLPGEDDLEADIRERTRDAERSGRSMTDVAADVAPIIGLKEDDVLREMEVRSRTKDRIYKRLFGEPREDKSRDLARFLLFSLAFGPSKAWQIMTAEHNQREQTQLFRMRQIESEMGRIEQGRAKGGAGIPDEGEKIRRREEVKTAEQGIRETDRRIIELGKRRSALEAKTRFWPPAAVQNELQEIARIGAKVGELEKFRNHLRVKAFGSETPPDVVFK